ncbi:D-hexose-6-phosphate mutarotase [Thalassotalea sp. PLHSN55]|uniref:D-hexose-6-phosphate mutarotase n=1 Tax=Thalassotalea sp. PLHSN55 TaxID=3435888 RepID=UPI003F856DB8
MNQPQLTVPKLPMKNEFGQVELAHLSDSHQALVIKHAFCTAKVSLYGGHVLAWQPQDQQPVFWLSNDATYTEGTAIRGGIPICWPWFGPHSKGDVKGNHGFARQSQWQLTAVDIEQAQVKIELTFTGENKHALWPNEFSVKQVLIFAEHFEQRLHITNLSDESVEYTAALHSYFQVSSPSNCQVSALEPADFDDKITGQYSAATALENCVGPLDRIYYTNEVCTLSDSQWQRAIEVTPLNTQQWVLWNPGTEVANAMADVHQGGEQEYVCLEAANTKWQQIQAKSTVVIGQKIRIINL